MTSKELMERRNRVLPKAMYTTSPLNAVSAKGAVFYDAEGKEYIDFSGGIGVLNAGHCPTPVSRAIAKQAQTLG